MLCFIGAQGYQGTNMRFSLGPKLAVLRVGVRRKSVPSFFVLKNLAFFKFRSHFGSSLCTSVHSTTEATSTTETYYGVPLHFHQYHKCDESHDRIPHQLWPKLIAEQGSGEAYAYVLRRWSRKCVCGPKTGLDRTPGTENLTLGRLGPSLGEKKASKNYFVGSSLG